MNSHQKTTNLKKNILILDNTLNFGGAISSLSQLVKALDKDCFEPIIVSGQEPERLMEYFPGCICYHLVPKLSWVDNQMFLKLIDIPFLRRGFGRRCASLLRYFYWLCFVYLPEGYSYYLLGKRHQVSAVHLNNIMGSQLSGIITAKLLRVPCIAHLRDFEEVHPLTRFYGRLINRHIAISSAIRENLLQLGIPAERISLVHDGIELEPVLAEKSCSGLFNEFGLTPLSLRFGIFGRVTNWKGVSEFLLAAQRVVVAIPDARAFVVGSSSAESLGFLEEMKQLAVQLGIEKHVIFTGYRRDVSKIMQFMDVIVHASTKPEPFGMVLIEGMALGKPVVATRGGGPLDIIVDGQTGDLVDMGDVDGMARAVIDLLQEPERAKRMGKAGRERVEMMFSNVRYATQMEEIYQEIGRKSHVEFDQKNYPQNC
jgi:glycosyltransferase involved in cell wall biosynthesis